MTIALTFDPAAQCTTGFYGFNMNPNYDTTGVELLVKIQQESDQIEDPLLIPVLFYGTWIDAIQREHGTIGRELRKVQEQTGLMSDYLRQHKIVEDVMNFDSVHRTLVLQHAYLTNGSSDFVRRLGPATMIAIDRVEAYYENQQPPGYKYDCTEVKQYMEHMQVRALTEMQHRQRMLDRISMYLQVVSWRPLKRLLTKLTTSTWPSCTNVKIITVIQSHAATNRPRNQTRLLGHEKHRSTDHDLPPRHRHSRKHHTLSSSFLLLLHMFKSRHLDCTSSLTHPPFSSLFFYFFLLFFFL